MEHALTLWRWFLTNREEIFRAIEFAGLLVGIAAVVIARIELRHVGKLLTRVGQIAEGSEELLRKSTATSRDTAQILNSMSTEYIGEFPFNLGAITDVVSAAKARVDIMVDIVAYGHYSNPDAFLKYYQCLQTLALNADISLRMNVYDETLNALGRDSQFGGSQAFPAIQTNRKFTQYFAKHTSKLPENYADFLKVLKDREDKRHSTLKGDGAEIRDSSERFRFFLWLVDGVEAVFAYQICGEHFREICFRTKDGNLIHTFADLFNQAWNSSGTTVPPPGPLTTDG